MTAARAGGDGPGTPAPGGELPAVLAIDGGNSKTDVALVAGDGTLLAMARGPGLPGARDLAASAAVLAGLVGTAQRRAGRQGGLVARHLSACVANVDLPEEELRLADALRASGWSESTAVANDTFAVLRAGWEGDGGARPWGIGVVCGAGINCVGVDPSGRTTRFLALGTLSGDWGGGFGLGHAMLWHAIRAEDGRGQDTALREAVAAHFGAATVADVAIGIHQGTIAYDAVLGLAPLLLAVAASGDRVARSLVDRQGREICAMALAAMRRLDLTGEATPVVLGGGLLAARDPLLTAAIVGGLADEAPRAVIRVTEVPPVTGAALLGLDLLGAGPAAERRLRGTPELHDHGDFVPRSGMNST